jgi:hypothetical protein
VYTSSILVVASNHFKYLGRVPKLIATGLPPGTVADPFLFPAADLGEDRFHDIGGARVGV